MQISAFIYIIYRQNADTFVVKGHKLVKSIIFGAVVGLINGFFGGGGGMIAVPILLSLVNGEEKRAHATAIFVILPISIASAVIYITTGQLSAGNVWWTILGLVIGGLLGACLLPKMKDSWIKILFIIIMAASGLYMLLK